MQPIQSYSTTISNRDTGESFSFVVVPRRSIKEGVELDAHMLADLLGLEGVAEAIPPEPWGLPFLIDALLGRTFPEYPRVIAPYPFARRRGEPPTAFAQYLAYAPVVPIEESPLEKRSLAEILTVTGTSAVVAGFALTGNPIVLLVVPAAMILCGGAAVLTEAMIRDLGARLNRDVMGVDGQQHSGSDE